MLDAVGEGLGSLFQETEALFEGSEVLSGSVFVLVAVFQELERVLGALAEELAEEIPRPLHAMQRLLWEHLERAVRDLVVVLWVLLRGVALR